MLEQKIVTATAPGKIILFGEHAVVYGRPAIAAPLTHVRAQAVIRPSHSAGVTLLAPDLAEEGGLDDAGPQDALALTVRRVQAAAGLQRLPDMTITVTSEIPIAAGLGSGAAITVATIRALCDYLGLEQLAGDKWISDLTFEIEKIHHGTPSGIDNTVVAYERPVYFVRQETDNLIETFTMRQPLRLLIGDTGISSSTRLVVGDVRRQWQADRQRFDQLFDECGQLTVSARKAIERGDTEETGRLMNENHALLVAMTVSSAELDRLVLAAGEAGALGAKLSGGGRGGNMIALVTAESEATVRAALKAAGAKRVLQSIIAPHSGVRL